MYETYSSAPISGINTGYQRVTMEPTNHSIDTGRAWTWLATSTVFGQRTSEREQSSTVQQSTQAQSSERSQSRSSPDTGPREPDSESTDEEDSGTDDSEEELPLDQVFEILKNRRRREVLHYLEDHGGDSSLSDLAEHIAAIENDTTVKAISSTQRKRVYVGLYQCHLPKMDDMNIVDFDQNRGTVVLSDNAEQVKSYLGEPEEMEWYKMYMGITLVGALLFLFAAAGGTSYGLSSSVVLLLLIGGITLCSVVHAFTHSGILGGDQ